MKLFFLFLGASLSFGAEYNLRNSCRERVAGIHLNYVDQNVTVGPRIDALKKKNKSIQLEINKTEKILTKSKDLLNSHATDIKLRESSLKQQVIVQKQLEDFRERLPPVFKIIHLPGKKAKGYMMQIEYTRECPRFQTGCPLTLKEKELVRKVFTGIEMPESCEKFLNLSDGSEK